MGEMSGKSEGAEGLNEATTTITQSMDIEDEKERSIAKAALSIAELGTFTILCV